MCPRRRRFDHIVAVFTVACAVFVLAWTFALGIAAEAAGTEGRTLFDRAFPFLLGIGAAAVLLWWARGSWRAGNRPPDPEQPHPDEPDRAQAHLGSAPPDGAPSDDLLEALPLTADGERELRRLVTVLGDAGVLAPEVPEADYLRGPVADYGGPVTVTSVLAALDEAAYYVAEFDTEKYSANLAFHTSHAEQHAEVVHEQIADIMRLAGGALADLTAVVEVADRAGVTGVTTTVRIVLGDTEQLLTYPSAAKYLSTALHVALARIIRQRRAHLRLAWVWSDQGVWLCGLLDGALGPLNDLLRPAADERWEWVDEQEPFAAGDLRPH